MTRKLKITLITSLPFILTGWAWTTSAFFNSEHDTVAGYILTTVLFGIWGFAAGFAITNKITTKR